ncbi:MAG TPA: flagellar hook-length control protein FliK, partial [Rhodospirillum rubrum]|nr:flagellar hook-length control protein FliK [Rhodospirillum rubrum]
KSLGPDTALDVRVRGATQASQDPKAAQAQQAGAQGAQSVTGQETLAQNTSQDGGTGAQARQQNATPAPAQPTPTASQTLDAQRNAPAAQAQVDFEKQVIEQQLAARQTGQSEALGRTDARQTAQQAVAQAAAAAPAATATTATTATQATTLRGGAEAIGATAATTAPQTTQSTRAAEAAPRSARTPTQAEKVVDQVKVTLGKALDRGIDRISVQLTPKELGRIEVKMEVSKDGQVSATIVADRPETLDMLRNDARGLERALQDAGLKADSGSLAFNLRGDPNAQTANGGEGGTGRNTRGGATGQDDPTAGDGSNDPAALDAARGQRASARGGVDIRV